MLKKMHRWTAFLRPLPKVGMVLIVRDEARFLDAHLRYHRWLGVERVYCYEHRCMDRSGAIASAYPWVQRILLEGHCPRREAYISELHRHCMNDALMRARRDHIDWLLIIDADEFVVPADRPRAGGLPAILRQLPDAIIEARLRTREVVACAEFGEDNWYQNPFFAIPERTPQPLAEGVTWAGYLGHQQGQRLVRKDAPVQAYDSHRWTAAMPEIPEGMPRYRPLPSVDIGWHAHYYLASPEHWLEKFTRHNDFPAHWPAPKTETTEAELPLEKPVALWRQAVARWGDDHQGAIREAKHRLFRPAALLRELANKPEGPLLDIDISLPAALQNVLQAPKGGGAPSGKPCRLPINELAEAPTLQNLPSGAAKLNLLIYEAFLSGFYDWEAARQRPFRWTSPTAHISATLAAGHYKIELQLKHRSSLAGPLTSLNLQVNGKPLAMRRRLPGSRITGAFQHSGGLFTLDLKVPRTPAPLDQRELGIPLVGCLLRR